MFLLLACTSPDDSAKAEDTATSEPTTLDTSTTDTGPGATWYFGTSDGQTPDGSYSEPTAEILFIRTLDDEASTITEEYWQEGRQDWDHGLLVHTVDATAGTFTATFDTPDGTLSVNGAFDAGDTWAWTAWHSLSVYTSGDYLGWVVESQDTVDEAGVATAHKSVYDADNVENWRIVEVITPTDETTFEARKAELGL